MGYKFGDIEKEIKNFWMENDVYRVHLDPSKPKYYALDFFPYPSGAGLHVGHPLGYIACDIVARFKRLKGFNVLHPMGFDSFGLPAEQYAIQTGQHPAVTTGKNIQTFKEQLDKIGFSFDWSREIRTSDPRFYKWTQWIFVQWFHSWYNKETDKAEEISLLIEEFKKRGNEKVEAVCSETKTFSASDWGNFSEKEKSDILLNYRLAYIADSWVNWCPALGTVLANDEVKDGVSERGGYPVERKIMKQWSLRITAYAERLLHDLEKIDWSEAIKETQRNWIGRSEGCSVKFEVAGSAGSPLLWRGAGGEEKEEMNPKNQPRYLTANRDSAYYLQREAARNRKGFTDAEKILWEELRNRKLGYKFRRHHPIDNFIADFVCLSKKLIIESDEEYHKEDREYDIERTKILNHLGYEVLRFWNEDVLKKTDEVISKITEVLKIPTEILTPNPSPGERGTPPQEFPMFIEVFTTRPDTIFGATFITLAPEHELVGKITTPEYKNRVEEYVAYAKNRSERDRMADVKKITGQFTGAYAIHPFSKKEIPIWIGEYVLATYGTGAVMSVPGHDERDHAFAKHFGLPIISILEGVDVSEKSFDDKTGTVCNSDFLNEFSVADAIKKAIDEIEKKGIGKRKVNYKLRDAIFGRQRYWGEPIPIYYDEEAIPHTVDEEDLPIVLPEVDKYLPTETGEPPLARAKDWYYQPLSNSPRGGENPLAPGTQDSESWGYETSHKLSWELLKENARENRKQSTEAESVLWQHLRNHQLGEHFRRQHAIGNFIADFVCLKKKLIVEVDGEMHLTQVEEDKAREEELQNLGFRIIRFKNEEVVNEVESVLQKIREALEIDFSDLGASCEGEVLPFGEDLGGADASRESKSLSPETEDLEDFSKQKKKYPLELTTMPGWAGSNWYYLRYIDPHNENELASKEAMDYWGNMDLYLGGDEHATGHLLYFRFCTKFLFDCGFIPFDEPAKKLVNQGKIQGVSQKAYLAKGVSNSESEEDENGIIRLYNIGISDRYDLSKHLEGIEIEHDKNEGEYDWSIFISADLTEGTDSLYLRNIPIKFVENEVLNIQAYVASLRSDRKSINIFLCLGGYWIDSVSYPKNNNSPEFRTTPAVEKMSKSLRNVVSPTKDPETGDQGIVEQYGADAFRLYEMFLGPLEQSKPWDTKGIDGVSRFLKKFWKLFSPSNLPEGEAAIAQASQHYDSFLISDEEPTKEELKILHRTIKKVSEDIEAMNFNTCVSAFMICVNELSQREEVSPSGRFRGAKRKILEPLLIVMSPFAPFITEYLWQKLRHTESIVKASFPKYDESLLVETSFEYPVAVNGKTRVKMNFDLNLPTDQIEKEVLSAEQLQKYFDGKTPKKVIVVKGRMINIVV